MGPSGVRGAIPEVEVDEELEELETLIQLQKKKVLVRQQFV